MSVVFILTNPNNETKFSLMIKDRVNMDFSLSLFATLKFLFPVYFLTIKNIVPKSVLSIKITNLNIHINE